MFGLKAKKPPDREAGQGKLFQRLRNGLSRTQAVLFTDVDELFRSKQAISEELLETLEDHLLMADVGVSASTDIMEKLRARIKKDKTDNAADLQTVLQESLHEILKPVEQPLSIPKNGKKPFVILMAGVNGVGKTTSIGKIASHLKNDGHSIMLAAGDTFRAAAVEQLQSWGERNEVPVIAQKSGADSAAVIYDALQAARSRNMDVLIADTAGRLHTQGNLMEELRKIRRVINKFDPDITPECLLVLDAGTGQNALVQTRQFNEAIGVTGLMLTKLDGTARGGIIFALAKETGIPVRFIGVGEKLEDLQVFNSDNFVAALFAENE